MKLSKTINTIQEKNIGYKCDICGKEIIFKLDFLPQYNTITWTHPSGEGGIETEEIDICSTNCFLKALKRVYFGAHIELSYDFLNSYREMKKEE